MTDRPIAVRAESRSAVPAGADAGAHARSTVLAGDPFRHHRIASIGHTPIPLTALERSISVSDDAALRPLPRPTRPRIAASRETAPIKSP